MAIEARAETAPTSMLWKFRRATFRGYDPDDVDTFLRSLIADR